MYKITDPVFYGTNQSLPFLQLPDMVWIGSRHWEYPLSNKLKWWKPQQGLVTFMKNKF